MCAKWFLKSIIPAIVCFHVQQYLNILRPILYYCMLLLIISIFVFETNEMGEPSVQILPWNPKFCPLCVAHDSFIPFSKYIGGLEVSVY